MNVIREAAIGFALGLLSYLKDLFDRGTTAVDAPVDRNLLRRGGDRIRRWLRENDSRSRGESDSDRT